MTAQHRRTPRHAAQRTPARAPFWAILVGGVAVLAIATGTLASAPLVEGTAHDPYDPTTGLNRDRMAAAAAILGRMDDCADAPRPECLYEDWTWTGMPAVVGEYNDDLLDAYDAQDGDAETFLTYAAMGAQPERDA